MNDDELKKLWQEQPLRHPEVSPAQLISAMQKQATLFRRRLASRDLGEVWACGFIIVVFGIFYFTVSRTPASRLGDLIVIGSSVFIAWKLVHTRRRTPPAPTGSSIVESLRAELKAVRAQSQLLGSILWWYLLPLAIGIFVCTWGSSGGGLDGLVGNIIYSAFVIALYAWIYRLNQRARSKQLLPLEAQLQSLIHSAETGEALDEGHAANLRPIVLSMSAAEHIKPAEFKLDFWQLAIYGVSGIVGIWLFWTLDRAMERERNARAKTPAADAQTFHGDPADRYHFEATTRYSAVAQKVVELFNAGDYSDIQKLYNADMSRVFPPEETSRFYTQQAALFGQIETIEGPVKNGFRGWTAFRLRCQYGEINMSVALDTEEKISGIHFRPVLPARPLLAGSVIRRMISWQYLAWLPLFFSGGLLYTWLIQKWAGRPVGVSSLGLHLSKGLNLVLWGEIQEVRPLRILNFRNLWLIKESGEKTLMHWTPLERHADVKAAVERHAPPDHPLRKHLSLLKRT
jgi:hypothetical protein